MRRALSLVGVLSILWLLLSGYFQPLLLAFGIASVILVVVVAWRMNLIDAEGHPIHLIRQALRYWPWLIVQIIKANVDVAKVIFESIISKGVSIRPVTFCVKTRQQGELAQVLFANSITLTPGTVSLTLENGCISVHALTAMAAADLVDGIDGSPSEMNQRCAELEERTPVPRTSEG